MFKVFEQSYVKIKSFVTRKKNRVNWRIYCHGAWKGWVRVLNVEHVSVQVCNSKAGYGCYVTALPPTAAVRPS